MQWKSITVYYTHLPNGPVSGTTQVGRYQKGKTNLDFTEARDSEWQWHQLDHMQVCTSLQTDNHASTQSLSFLQTGCPSCRPTNSVKALKALEAWTCRNYTWPVSTWRRVDCSWIQAAAEWIWCEFAIRGATSMSGRAPGATGQYAIPRLTTCLEYALVHGT